MKLLFLFPTNRVSNISDNQLQDNIIRVHYVNYLNVVQINSSLLNSKYAYFQIHSQIHSFQFQRKLITTILFFTYILYTLVYI